MSAKPKEIGLLQKMVSLGIVTVSLEPWDELNKKIAAEEERIYGQAREVPGLNDKRLEFAKEMGW